MAGQEQRSALATLNAGSNPRFSLGPSKALQKATINRLSMAPPAAARQSLLLGAAGRKSMLPVPVQESRQSIGRPSTGRQSIMNRMSLAPGTRQSMAPSRPSTAARQSTGAGTAMSRRSSVHAAATGVTDPRPLSDKDYRHECIKKVITFLTENGYSYPLSKKILAAPSNKDVIQIFQFLYHQIDPFYEFEEKGMEDEIPSLLKTLRYPATINKSAIFSCGSPHNWPKLLGALTWMIELIEYFHLVDINKAIFSAGSNNDGFDADAANENEVFFDYLTKAYATFFQGEEDYNQLVQELEDSFKAKNESIGSELDVLEQENIELERELAELQSTPAPIITLTETHAQFLADSKRFTDYIHSLEEQLAKQKTVLREKSQELDQRMIQLEAAETERTRLADVHRKQELTPADVERINSTRRKQDEQINHLTELKNEMESRVWKQEVQIEKKIEELETAVRAYNRLGEKLQLLGASAKFTQVNFAIQLNTHASKADEIVSSSLTEHIRPAIAALTEQITQSQSVAQAEALTLSETLRKLEELRSEKQDDISIMESNLAALEKQYNEEKEIMSIEYKEKAGDINSLQAEISRMRASAASAHLEHERMVEKLRIELQDQQIRCNHEMKELQDRVFKALELVTVYKSFNQEQVASLSKHVRDLEK